MTAHADYGKEAAGRRRELITVATMQPRQTQDARSSATREKLMDGAYRVLLEFGHAGLRSANISREAGVSRGGLLHHYPSKELLIAAVYERIVEKMENESAASIDATLDEHLLEAIVADACRRFQDESFKVMLDILVASGQEEPVIQIVDALRSRYPLPAKDAWAARLAKSGVEPVLAAQITSFLWNTVKGLAVRAFVQKDEDHQSRVIKLALTLANRRCNAAAASPPASPAAHRRHPKGAKGQLP